LEKRIDGTPLGSTAAATQVIDARSNDPYPSYRRHVHVAGRLDCEDACNLNGDARPDLLAESQYFGENSGRLHPLVVQAFARRTSTLPGGIPQVEVWL
jgi:hypothetical protein